MPKAALTACVTDTQIFNKLYIHRLSISASDREG
jgi:hypothetical protein